MTSSIVPRSSPMAAARLSTPTGPPSNFSITMSSRRRSSASKPCSSTSSSRARRAAMPRRCSRCRPPGRSRARAAAGGWRCAACRARARRCAAAPSASIGTPRMPAERVTMRASSARGVELQPLHDAEAVAQRRGQQAGARGGADQRERRQVELDGARRRALADHDVELVVLQRRIQDFLDHRAQAMDLIDEQHVVRLQVGEDRARDRPAAPAPGRRSGAGSTPSSCGDDVRERGLAEARRPEQQHVVERLAARPRARR